MKKMLCIAGILALAGAQSSFAAHDHGPSYSSASGKSRVYSSHQSLGLSIGSHSSGHSSPYSHSYSNNSHNSHNSYSYSNSHNSYNSHSYSSNSHSSHNPYSSHSYSSSGSHYPSSHNSYNSYSSSHSPSYGLSISVGSVPSYSSSHYSSSYSYSHQPRVCTKRHGHYEYRSEKYISGYNTRQEKYYVPGSTYKVWDPYTNCYIYRTNGGHYSYRTVKVPYYATRRVQVWVSSPCNCF